MLLYNFNKTLPASPSLPDELTAGIEVRSPSPLIYGDKGVRRITKEVMTDAQVSCLM